MTVDTILKVFISSVIVLTLTMIIDRVGAQKEPFYATVIDKSYQAPSSSSGSGVGVSTNGDPVVVTTTSSTPQKFILVVRNYEGEVITIDCDPTNFYDNDIGDSIECYHVVGLITKARWKTKTIKKIYR